MAARRAVMYLGFDVYKSTDDRRVLENDILPWYARQDDLSRILFVGCEWYTRGYRRQFDHKSYWTIDYDPEKQQYGAERHITDSLTNLTQYFGKDELDLIVCNGVFGWGLDDPDQIEAAFSACHTVLRDGGHFMLGWNDIPPNRPFPPEQSTAIQAFHPFLFPPLATHRHLTDNPNRHTFDFYVK